MKFRVALIVAVVCAAIGAGITPAFAAVGCGSTITQNTTLHKDLVNCPGTGITVGDDNIVLDLNGHTIDGDGSANVGVLVSSKGGVVIKNGTVKQFGTGGAGGNGIELDSSANIAVSHLHLIQNGHAIRFCDTTVSRILNNNIVAGFNGILLTCGASNGNTIKGNVIKDNVDTSIRLNGADNNKIIGNTLTWGGHHGIYLLGSSDNNRIVGNTIKTMENEGIVVEDSDTNTIRANVVSANEGGIDVTNNIATSDGNKLLGNTITASPTADGIFVQNGTTGTVLTANKSNGNAADGILVSAGEPATILTNNVANNNGSDGINAATGVTDGGGNTATGNGATNCIGVSC